MRHLALGDTQEEARGTVVRHRTNERSETFAGHHRLTGEKRLARGRKRVEVFELQRRGLVAVRVENLVKVEAFSPPLHLKRAERTESTRERRFKIRDDFA